MFDVLLDRIYERPAVIEATGELDELLETLDVAFLKELTTNTVKRLRCRLVSVVKLLLSLAHQF